jgi:hypothetical protein
MQYPTLRKKKIKFPHIIYKEIHSGAVAKPYMRKGFLIQYMRKCANFSPYMRRPLVIYENHDLLGCYKNYEVFNPKLPNEKKKSWVMSGINRLCFCCGWHTDSLILPAAQQNTSIQTIGLPQVVIMRFNQMRSKVQAVDL